MSFLSYLFSHLHITFLMLPTHISVEQQFIKIDFLIISTSSILIQAQAETHSQSDSDTHNIWIVPHLSQYSVVSVNELYPVISTWKNSPEMLLYKFDIFLSLIRVWCNLRSSRIFQLQGITKHAVDSIVQKISKRDSSSHYSPWNHFWWAQRTFGTLTSTQMSPLHIPFLQILISNRFAYISIPL